MLKRVREDSRLLQIQKKQNYDVIALQEPSYNSQTERTHCSKESDFWPVYEKQSTLRWHFCLTRDWTLTIGVWSRLNDCIQMAQVQTSQSLIQLINVHVMTDED